MDENEKLASIAKLEAETKLLNAQINEIQSNLKKGCFIEHPIVKIFIQLTVAGIILAGSFFFLFEPIMKTAEAIRNEKSIIANLKSEQAQLRNVIQKEENELLKQDNEKKSAALEKENQKIKRQLQKLIATSKQIEKEKGKITLTAKILKKEQEKLQSEYKKLSKDLSRTNANRNLYKVLAKKAGISSEKLSNQLKLIKLNQETSKELTSVIINQLKTLDIKGKSVIVMYNPSRKIDSDKAIKKLRKAGAFVYSSASNRSGKNVIYYSKKSDKNVASQIANLVSEIQKTEVEYKEGIGQDLILVLSK